MHLRNISLFEIRFTSILNMAACEGLEFKVKRSSRQISRMKSLKHEDEHFILAASMTPPPPSLVEHEKHLSAKFTRQ